MLKGIVGLGHVVEAIQSSLPGHAYPQPLPSPAAYPITSAVDYERLQHFAALRSSTGCTELYGVTVIQASLQRIINTISRTPGLSQALLSSMIANNLLTQGTYASLSQMSDRDLARNLIHRILGQVGDIPSRFATFIKMLMEQTGCQELAQYLIRELERLAANPPLQTRPLFFLPDSRF